MRYRLKAFLAEGIKESQPIRDPRLPRKRFKSTLFKAYGEHLPAEILALENKQATIFIQFTLNFESRLTS